MNTPKGFIDDRIVALMNDKELLAKLDKIESQDEVYAIVKAKVDFSHEEIVAQVEIAKSCLAAMNKEAQAGELNEGDLDMVAGGKNYYGGGTEYRGYGR